MSRASLIVALAAFAASTPVNAFGGLTAPERLTHSYQLQCGGRQGAVVLEERFDRRGPSRTVAIKAFTPLGGGASRSVSNGVARAAASMGRIDRVDWLCEPGRTVIVIQYLDRATYEQAIKADRPVLDEPESLRRTYLVLDSKDLTVQTAGAAIGREDSARNSRGR